MPERSEYDDDSGNRDNNVVFYVNRPGGSSKMIFLMKTIRVGSIGRARTFFSHATFNLQLKKINVAAAG
jgi:hypothetical protein